jgi:putative membrane protein
MNLFIEFFISGLAVAASAYIIPGVSVDSYWTALIVALVFSLVNIFIGGFARIITAPLNFLTLGLISFLISGIIVLLTDRFVDGFSVDGYLPALIFALVLGIIRSVFVLQKKKKKK